MQPGQGAGEGCRAGRLLLRSACVPLLSEHAAGDPAASKPHPRAIITTLGLTSIAKGTLPLVLFGPFGYASLMGRLAMPSLLAQALSPSIRAILI